MTPDRTPYAYVPCRTCGGTRRVADEGDATGRWWRSCPDCGGTGRRTPPPPSDFAPCREAES